jgi:hypothetical protein
MTTIIEILSANLATLAIRATLLSEARRNELAEG